MLRRLTRVCRLVHQHDLLVTSEVKAASNCSREQQRFASKLPSEYQHYYKSQNLTPKARPRVQDAKPAEVTGSSVQMQEASTSGKLESTAGTESVQSAQAASVWMLPWERRQMDGGGKPLRTWEKLYWGVFVTAMAWLLFSRLYNTEKPDPKVDEEKEARKLQRARLILAGHTVADDDDPFEGLTPQEIEQYVQKATAGASASDPFEGMSPEEINAYVEQHGAKLG